MWAVDTGWGIYMVFTEVKYIYYILFRYILYILTFLHILYLISISLYVLLLLLITGTQIFKYSWKEKFSSLVICLSLYLVLYASHHLYAAVFVPSLAASSCEVGRILGFGGNTHFTREVLQQRWIKRNYACFGMWYIFLMKIK